ncbi:NAD(P)-dependent oxidoreductase [Saccharopolyspora dendranthemae]|uniref:D-3-phosphoglycerate dehydrogenase n=1 Tax=Saccharopolyspora dendranthemae TaxID=1181886 RepID=A0A561U7W6_9PSEU|nr:NAD(P)-dependent oxidoreductase [Saccharopolyspora dendranthemae]TWF95452.1 D-3-phosphoglycerate dehydrogenase [Saccharopolyspora dendranthemae]
MRILVADAFPEEYRHRLVAAHDCDYEPDTTADQLPAELAGYEVLVVRSTRVTAQALESADALRLVLRAGSGTNTIDHDAASRLGIHVCNVPGRNAIAVAELACALLLAIDRNVADNVADLRAGSWDKKRYSRARGLFGRDVGVVGLGQVGLAFAERAAAFGTRVHAVTKPGRDDATLDRAQAIGITFVDDLPELARTCDVLSLHVPATDTTTRLIDRELLAQMRPGTIILNTARGDLIDEDALIEAMETKGVRAGIDVFADEPTAGTGTFRSRLAAHPNVCGTHHIGASTEQAQEAVAAEAVHVIEEFAAGTVLHCVNPRTPREFASSLPTSDRT